MCGAWVAHMCRGARAGVGLLRHLAHHPNIIATPQDRGTRNCGLRYLGFSVRGCTRRAPAALALFSKFDLTAVTTWVLKPPALAPASLSATAFAASLSATALAATASLLATALSPATARGCWSGCFHHPR